MQSTAEVSLEQKRYQQMVDEVSPDSKVFANCVKAFWTGGAICVLGQIVSNILISLGYQTETASAGASVFLIIITAVLTGFGVYDNLGKYCGAGSIVPITGFANSVVAPAMEFKKEGFIFGVGAKIFIIAGPVILYGTATSVIVGIIYCIVKWVM